MTEQTKQSRRGFLGFLSLTAAASAAPVVDALAAKQTEIDESKPSFTHPAEYLAAMQAIGWRPTAMYHRTEAGGIVRMGVNESAADKESIQKTWLKFHAIQMRCPVQLPFDVHPDQDWWKWVWQHLYDRGLREDVTPPKLAARLDAELS